MWGPSSNTLTSSCNQDAEHTSRSSRRIYLYNSIANILQLAGSLQNSPIEIKYLASLASLLVIHTWRRRSRQNLDDLRAQENHLWRTCEQKLLQNAAMSERESRDVGGSIAILGSCQSSSLSNDVRQKFNIEKKEKIQDLQAVGETASESIIREVKQLNANLLQITVPGFLLFYSKS